MLNAVAILTSSCFGFHRLTYAHPFHDIKVPIEIYEKIDLKPPSYQKHVTLRLPKNYLGKQLVE